MKTPARRSSRAWVNSILRSFGTACSANSRSTPTAGKPQIAYRETITASATGEGKLIKQSGGRGQYGHVVVNGGSRQRTRQRPLHREQSRRRDDSRRNTSRLVKKGIEEAVLNGVIGGYPVIDVNVEIIDGSYHDVDSNELAFKLAAIFAMKDGFKKAKAILLEPIMKVEVASPPTSTRETSWGISIAVVRRIISTRDQRPSTTNPSTRRCRSPRCSGMRPPSAPCRKGAPPIRWSLAHFEQVPAGVLAEVLDQKDK